jgi:hypothetical protein
MKTEAIFLMVVIWAGHEQAGRGQGTFRNLDFESAKVSGYSFCSTIPADVALPGWTVDSSQGYVFVGYDALSLGGAAVTICDTNLFGNMYGNSFAVLQGKFSAFLFGGEFGPATISQTGLVPSSSQSLQMRVGTGWNPTLFSVSLGGQTVNMMPLAWFPTYTLYGGDISSLAGQVATLSLTAPTPPSPIVPPSFFLVDAIVFSPIAVSEPNTTGLFALGGFLLLSRFVIYRARMHRHC